jgi:hypothetical protein
MAEKLMECPELEGLRAQDWSVAAVEEGKMERTMA